MIASFFKEAGGIKLDELLELPVDVVFAFNYYLTTQSIRENLPEEYQPKGYQWLFDDEISKCIKRFKASLEDKKERKVDTSEVELDNPLADRIKENFLKGEID